MAALGAHAYAFECRFDRDEVADDGDAVENKESGRRRRR